MKVMREAYGLTAVLAGPGIAWTLPLAVWCLAAALAGGEGEGAAAALAEGDRGGAGGRGGRGKGKAE